MSSFATIAIDASFAQFGKAAVYTPRGGGNPLACRVIVDRADRDLNVDVGNLFSEGNTIEVRAAEVASPERGGTFLVDGSTYSVQSDPKSSDPDRLVFVCAVSA